MSIKINTVFWRKPIPDKNFDWEAWYDNDDGAPCGFGATKEDAIKDLTDNYPREERAA